MKLSLIGMSNIGKTYFTTALKPLDWEYIGIDEMIASLLKKKRGIDVYDTDTMARWLGQPYDTRYAKRSKIYLSYEDAAMQFAIEQAKKRVRKKLCIDTTGSVIHLPEETLDLLKQYTTIVYLEAPPDHTEAMKKAYFAHPKPVIWPEGVFTKRTAETPQDALKRSYVDLLSKRAEQYEQLADWKLPAQLTRIATFDVGQFTGTLMYGRDTIAF